MEEKPKQGHNEGWSWPGRAEAGAKSLSILIRLVGMEKIPKHRKWRVASVKQWTVSCVWVPHKEGKEILGKAAPRADG